MGDEQVGRAEGDLRAIRADRPMGHSTARRGLSSGELKQTKQVDWASHVLVQVDEDLRYRHDSVRR